jgi:predicted dehydrogenase
MCEPVKTGVFGVGSLGQWHARIYSELAEADLVGVYDPDRRRAEEIAARYGTRAFADLDELASSVTAASVAAPTDRHCEMFLKLAARNCHVLMEKPIADTPSDAARMTELAKEKGLVLQVGHVERFNPVMQYLAARLAGRPPRYVEALRLAPYPPPRPHAPPRGTEVSVVLDLMIHDLDLLLHLVGAPVARVSACGSAVLSPGTDLVSARLLFENGCVAHLVASRISPQRRRQWRVFDDDAYLSLDCMNHTASLSRKAQGALETRNLPIVKTDALEQQLAAFLHSVRSGTPPAVSAQEATAALALAMRIEQTVAENPS